MRGMELKVWVEGVQRVVCGVTELTTCQEVVIALAQAIGQTGRYTLLEKWRETERHLAPSEKPVVSLNKWGQYACDVQLVLQRTGPSCSERPGADGSPRVPERGLHRQSLPPWAKLRPLGADRSLKRREPKRKSLTFSGGAKGLREIFGKSRDSEAKQQQRAANLNLSQARGGTATAPPPSPVPPTPSPGPPPPSPARQLGVLVQLQRDRLRALDEQLRACQAELQTWERSTEDALGGGGGGGGTLEEEIVRLEQQLRREEVEMREEEVWQKELQAEQEGERRLRKQLAQLRERLQDCEAQLRDYLARIQSMEAGLERERQQQEAAVSQQASEEEEEEEEVLAQLEEVRAELDLQTQLSAQLESSYRSVEGSQGQAVKRLQERERELEQLTKELRRVNLQHFIQQTGTKVTVLPSPPCHQTANNHDLQSGSLRQLGSARQLPCDLRALQSAAAPGLDPEGIYV